MNIENIMKCHRSYAGRIYSNKKTGKMYRVWGVGCDATNARDGNPVVIYNPIHLSDFTIPFLRDIEEFEEKFVGE